MAKYTIELKLEIVKKVINGMTQNEAVKQYGVVKGDVQKWVAAYQAHGEGGLSKKHSSYTGGFKQAVVEDIRRNNISYREAAAKYNLGGHTVISGWERIYLEEGAEGLYIDRRGRSSSSKSGRPPKLDKKTEEDLIAENQRLRMENNYLKKLNALVRERELSEKKKKLR